MSWNPRAAAAAVALAGAGVLAAIFAAPSGGAGPSLGPTITLPTLPVTTAVAVPTTTVTATVATPVTTASTPPVTTPALPPATATVSSPAPTPPAPRLPVPTTTAAAAQAPAPVSHTAPRASAPTAAPAQAPAPSSTGSQAAPAAPTAAAASAPSAAPAASASTPAYVPQAPAARSARAGSTGPHARPAPRERPRRVLRVHVAGGGRVLVVVRRIANCRVAARTHVDLARTHGVVPLRSRVGSKRLAHGVYVVTVWRVESTTPVRTTVIRVRRDHRVVRLHRRAPTCRSGAVAGGPVAGAPAPRATGAVAVLTGFAGATPAISLTPPTTEIASRPVVAATSGASKVRVPTPAEISRAAGGGVFGALFAGALIALLVACPIAIAVYVWRFLHAPAEPS